MRFHRVFHGLRQAQPQRRQSQPRNRIAALMVRSENFSNLGVANLENLELSLKISRRIIQSIIIQNDPKPYHPDISRP